MTLPSDSSTTQVASVRMSGEDKHQEQQQQGDCGLPGECAGDGGGQEDGDPGGSSVAGLGHGVKVG